MLRTSSPSGDRSSEIGKGTPEATAAPPSSLGVKKSTVLNLGGSLLLVAVSLFTVPIYLGTIGEHRYGTLALAWLLLGTFNPGMSRIAAHHVAKLRHSRDEAARTVWTALILGSVIGCVSGGLLFVTGHVLVANVLKIPPEIKPEAVALLPWLALAVPLTLVGSILSGCLEGWERFGEVNLLDCVSGILAQVAPLCVALWIRQDLATLVATTLAVRLGFGVIGTAIACVRLCPELVVPRFDRSRAKELIHFGGWLSVSWLINPLLRATDRFLIGVQAGVQAVSHYSIPLSLAESLLMLPSGFSRVLFARFSSLGGEASAEFGNRATKALAAAMTPVAVAAIFCIRPFLEVWIGPEMADRAGLAGEILLVGIWVNSLAFIPYTLLQGMGRPDLTAKFHLVEVVPYVFALWLGLAWAGVAGAAFAWTLRVSLDAALLFLAAGQRRQLPVLAPAALLVLAALIAAAGGVTQPVFRAVSGGLVLLLSVAWAWSVVRSEVPLLLRRQAQ